MTPPVRPEQIGGFLDDYFAHLQVPGIAPDATAVARQRAPQLPAGGTIGPQRWPSGLQAPNGLPQDLAWRALERLHKGYPAREAAHDVASMSGATGIVGGLKHADAGELAGGLLDAALNVAPELKAAGALKNANPEILKIVEGLRAGPKMPRVAAIDAGKAAHMASVYEGLPKFDPAAKPAYDALNAEVEAQHNALTKAGYKFDYVDQDPYKNSAEMLADVRNNKTLKVFKTPSDAFHPYMTPEQNDKFRAVHDAIAHAGEGNQFGPIGEENAYRVHASTLSPEAQRALATETRGQNSWVNFGPNAHLPQAERPFAEQKAALWPAHLLGDYHEMTPPAPTLPDKYAILTAENPAGKFNSPTVNTARNGALAKRLTEEGHQFTPVKGAYTDPTSGQLLHENSFLVHGIEPDKAERLARDFSQNGVVTHQGYHDLASGTLHPSSGVTGTIDAPYTELPGGERFASKIDWDTGSPLAAPAAPTPALNFLKDWQPTSRGVFDRGAPKIQGQMPSDPRLVVPTPKTDRMTTSPLVDAIRNSRTVPKGLDQDVNKGLLMGGPEWYELGPIKADLDARAGTGAMSFSDFNNLGGGSSASNSVPNELSAMSVGNYARVNGLSREEAVQHFLQQTRSPVKAPLMDMHMNLGFKGIQDGAVLPSNPMSEAWKIPSYVDKRMGGGGLLDVDAPGGMPALDTHERRRIMQLVMENPALRKVAKATGAVDAAANSKGALPLRNALDYKAISELYTDGAKRYGLPTAGAYQAPRWTGGWDKTGLKSPPTGDFVQILEDALKYSAQRRGFDDSPAGLRKYWGRIVEGKDFILPFSGKGYYPIK